MSGEVPDGYISGGSDDLEDLFGEDLEVDEKDCLVESKDVIEHENRLEKDAGRQAGEKNPSDSCCDDEEDNDFHVDKEERSERSKFIREKSEIKKGKYDDNEQDCQLKNGDSTIEQIIDKQPSGQCSPGKDILSVDKEQEPFVQEHPNVEVIKWDDRDTDQHKVEDESDTVKQTLNSEPSSPCGLEEDDDEDEEERPRRCKFVQEKQDFKVKKYEEIRPKSEGSDASFLIEKTLEAAKSIQIKDYQTLAVIEYLGKTLNETENLIEALGSDWSKIIKRKRKHFSYVDGLLMKNHKLVLPHDFLRRLSMKLDIVADHPGVDYIQSLLEPFTLVFGEPRANAFLKYCSGCTKKFDKVNEKILMCLKNLKPSPARKI